MKKVLMTVMVVLVIHLIYVYIKTVQVKTYLIDNKQYNKSVRLSMFNPLILIYVLITYIRERIKRSIGI